MVGVQPARIISLMESLQPFVRKLNAYEYTMKRIELQDAGEIPSDFFSRSASGDGI